MEMSQQSGGSGIVQLIRRIKPAGWVALGAILVLAVGVLSVVITFVVRNSWTLGTTPMEEYQARAPTRTPTVTPRAATPTPGPMNTPEGWAIKTDVIGQEYLAPPPEIEAAVEEVRDSIVGVGWVQIESAEVPTWDELPTLEDRQALAERANELTAIEGLVWKEGHLCEIVPAEHWGLDNPIICDDHDTCYGVWVKQGPAVGMVGYGEEVCQEHAGAPAPCMLLDFADSGRVMVTITVEPQADGVWRAIDFDYQPLD
jgi:hypothetical protein